MLRAGLALAGANAREGGGEDDGILTALEAAALDLDGVGLVVLSACDTARGAPRARQGVLGLVRGFRQAGARHVIASLWPVYDVTTSRLMDQLYEQVLEAKAPAAPAAALRRAALALRAHAEKVVDEEASLLAGREVTVERRPWAAPRSWAAFVAYGPR